MGIGGTDTQPRLSPSGIAVNEHIHSQSTSTGSRRVQQSNTRPAVISRRHQRSQPLIAPAQATQPQPTTPAIRVEQAQPFAVTHTTPLPVPATPKPLAGTVPRSVPPVPEKPQGYAGLNPFLGVGAQSTTVYCSPARRIEGRTGGGVAFYHAILCIKSYEDLIEYAPKVTKLKKSQCKL